MIYRLRLSAVTVDMERLLKLWSDGKCQKHAPLSTSLYDDLKGRLGECSSDEPLFADSHD
jgi:hypothetical protein